MLSRIEFKMASRIAMQQCTRRYHFGIKTCLWSELAMEKPAMTVCDIDHGRDTQAPQIGFGGRQDIICSDAGILDF